VTSGFWQRLDIWARRFLPAGLSLLFVLVTVVPVPMPGYASLVPMLTLAAVFFWAVHDPRLLPPIVIFAIGLIQDSLSGAPMGTGTVVLLAVYGITVAQRRTFRNRSFIQVWAGFTMVAATAVVLQWLLTVAVDGAFAPPRVLLFQSILTIAVYPLVTWVLHLAQRLLPAEE
jgi:rod shape-determining protein MreD